MKILHVVPTYLPAWRYGGPIRSIHSLCTNLALSGHEVCVVTTNVDGDAVLDVPLNESVIIDRVNIRYFEVENRRTFFSIEMWKYISKNLQLFDVVHLHSVFLFPTTIAAYYSRKYRIPYVISPRGMLVSKLIRKKGFLRKRIWMWFFEARNIKWAWKIHATSEVEMADLISLGVSSSRIRVIYNGLSVQEDFDPSHNKVESGKDFKRPYILYVGRLSWKKGLDNLINAIAYVPDHKLYVVGNDENNYRAKLSKLIDSINVNDRVFFTGELLGDKKIAAFEGADLLVLPSLSENFGNVVLEGLSRGCPVAVTSGVGLAEFVKEHNLGIIVESEPVQMGKKITSFLQDQHMLSDIRTRAKAVVQEHFSWGELTSRFSDLYREIREAEKGSR